MPPPTEDDSLKRIEDERLKWCIPNWRNPSEYEYTNHNFNPPLINDQLRWEFVRRLSEYRENWENADFCRSKFNLISPIHPAKRGDNLGNKNILFIDTVLRGGLLELTIPHTTYESNMSIEEQENGFALSVGKHVLQLINDGYLLIGFDPSLPDTEQKNRASLILEKKRNALIKFSQDEIDDGEEGVNEITFRQIPIKFPSQLLRTLDAHNEKANHLEIAQVIYGLDIEDSSTKADARSVVYERIKEAQKCWKRVIPEKRNVLL